MNPLLPCFCRGAAGGRGGGALNVGATAGFGGTATACGAGLGLGAGEAAAGAAGTRGTCFFSSFFSSDIRKETPVKIVVLSQTALRNFVTDTPSEVSDTRNHELMLTEGFAIPSSGF